MLVQLLRLETDVMQCVGLMRDPSTLVSRPLDSIFLAGSLIKRFAGLPTDMVFTKIPADRLEKPINLELRPNHEDTEAEVVKEIAELMYNSTNTIIISDACAVRHRVVPQVHELMDKTNLPTFVSPMGKSSINETHPAFGGVYAGDVSRDDVKKRIEEAELVLFVGGLKSDFNSGGFTYRIETKNTIEFHSDHMKVTSTSRALVPKLTLADPIFHFPWHSDESGPDEALERTRLF